MSDTWLTEEARKKREREKARAKEKTKAAKRSARGDKERDDNTDIAYLIVAVAGMLAAGRLWQVKIKPWLNSRLADVSSGPDGHVIGSLTVVDAVGIAILGVPLLVAVWLWLRRRRRTA